MAMLCGVCMCTEESCKGPYAGMLHELPNLSYFSDLPADIPIQKLIYLAIWVWLGLLRC